MKIGTLPCIVIALALLAPLAAHAGDVERSFGLSNRPVAVKRLATGTVKTLQNSALTVVINNAEHTVIINESTKITKKGHAVPASDIKSGSRARISFKEHGSRKIATIIEVYADEPRPDALDQSSTKSGPPAPPVPAVPPMPSSPTQKRDPLRIH